MNKKTSIISKTEILKIFIAYRLPLFLVNYNICLNTLHLRPAASGGSSCIDNLLFFKLGRL